MTCCFTAIAIPVGQLLDTPRVRFWHDQALTNRRTTPASLHGIKTIRDGRAACPRGI